MSDCSDPRLTEARNPRTGSLDRADPAEIVSLIQAEDRRVPAAVESQAGTLAVLIAEVSRRMKRGGRLVYVGAGTSGRLAVLDASECPPTFGTDPGRVVGIIAGGNEALVRSREGVEDDRAAGRRAIREAEVMADDFVLGIATSGTTPYVQAAVLEAAERGAGIGFLSCTPPPEEMRRVAEFLLTPLVGPEVIAGSTRMKAGTATKLLLNTLTTGVMIRLGKVYQNLMVDLQAVSRKQAGRSIRIVCEVTGAEPEEARRLLVAAGGSAKTAIAMAELATSRAVAERVLDASDDFLGVALERFRGSEPIPYYACYPEDLGETEEETIRRRLREGPRRIETALAERGRAPPEGARSHSWTPSQHVAHLIEAERNAFRPRLSRMLAAMPEAELRFPDWPPTDPPPRGEETADRLLTAFRQEREETLALLDDAEPRDWSRRASIGEEPVRLHQLLRGMVQHDRAHATRIAERVHPALREPR